MGANDPDKIQTCHKSILVNQLGGAGSVGRCQSTSSNSSVAVLLSLSSLCFWCLCFVWLCFCVFCCFCVLWLFAVSLLWNRDGSWTMYRSHTSSLLWPTTNGDHLYALVS